jgi:alpha-beta hydrolase superfamily lysophospholipase
VDYLNQLEDDVADLISLIRDKKPGCRIIVGGHSSGGGLAVRFAGSRYGNQADAYLLLSPYLKYNAPTMRPNSGGWTLVNTPRIVGLSMLNNLGIHWLDYLPVISFNMPEEARDGTETLAYSHRLNTAYAPRNYKKDLAHITQPFLVVAGSADDAFIGEQFEPVISRYTEVEVILIPDATHFGVVVGPEIRPIVGNWLESF